MASTTPPSIHKMEVFSIERLGGQDRIQQCLRSCWERQEQTSLAQASCEQHSQVVEAAVNVQLADHTLLSTYGYAARERERVM